jgi:hypothetical protein
MSYLSLPLRDRMAQPLRFGGPRLHSVGLGHRYAEALSLFSSYKCGAWWWRGWVVCGETEGPTAGKTLQPPPPPIIPRPLAVISVPCPCSRTGFVPFVCGTQVTWRAEDAAALEVAFPGLAAHVQALIAGEEEN